MYTTEEEKYKRIITISIVIAVLAILAGIFTSTLILVPVLYIECLYIILFRYLNLKLIKKFNKFKFTKVLFYISCVTLVLGCVFLPMYDYAGNESTFLGLVKNSPALDILESLDYVLLTINVITIILELIINLVLNKRKEKTE